MGVFTLVLVCGCRSETGAGSTGGIDRASGKPSQHRPHVAALSLRDLTRACDEALGRVGSYHLSARSRLERSGKGLVPKVVEQRVDLRGDGTGRYAARKTTDPQYGSEVIWDGRSIYSRLRHNPFTRRSPEDSQEPRRLLERYCGLLPAYLRLLAPSVRIRAVAEVGRREGRVVKRFVLSGRANPADQRRWDADSSRWRRTVKVEHLAGELDWDEQKQLPLYARIEARWSFTPPAKFEPETGIPRELGIADAGRMSLDFEQRIDQLGAEQHIAAPPEDQLATRVRRLRLEIERQMVVGERPLVPKFAKGTN